MFDIEGAKVLEIVARVAIVYTACMVLLRISGRREMSQLTPMDLLAMLLLSETVSPAMTGGDETVTGGVIAATALIALAVLTAWIAFRYHRIEKLLQGEAIVLVEDGKVRTELLGKYRISSDDLDNALHQHGLLHMEQVKRAYVEADGEITIITRKNYDEWIEQRRRRLDRRGHPAPA